MPDAKHISEASRPLATLVTVDPEALPMGTAPNYTFRYIDIASATQGRLLLPDDEVDYRHAPSRARRVVRDQDVIMSTVRPNLKAFAYCRLPPGNFVASTGFAVLRAKEGTDPRFILYSILSDDVTRQIERFVVGSNYPAINSSDVKRLRIPNLSLGDQESIGEIIGTVDEAIEQIDALIVKTQQIKAGLMHDLFTRGVNPDGQLRPPREEAPQLYKESPLGWIPKEWAVLAVDGLLDRIIDYRGKTPTKTSSGIPLITAKNVRMGYVDPEPREFIASSDYKLWMTRGIPAPSDILFTTEAPLGNIAQVMITDKVAFAQRVIILRPSIDVCPGFLKYRLMCSDFQNGVMGKASGTTALGIKQSEFRKLLVSFPVEKSEQAAIERLLTTIDAQLQSELTTIQKLRAERSGLMNDLLSGHVGVEVSFIEPVHGGVANG